MLSTLWAVFRFTDDFYDPFVGPDIRRELSAASVSAYAWLLPLQGLLPAVLTVAMLVSRRRRQAQGRTGG